MPNTLCICGHWAEDHRYWGKWETKIPNRCLHPFCHCPDFKPKPGNGGVSAKPYPLGPPEGPFDTREEALASISGFHSVEGSRV